MTLNCFSTKIKCGCCGRSFVRSKKKKHPGQVDCTSGVIRESVLKEEIAKVLSLPDFDENAFTARVKQITIPETGTLIFEFTDSSTLEHHWHRNFKKDAWTKELREQASAYRRTHPANKKGKTCFTAKIRCEKCGGNYRRQAVTMADVHQNSYWHCCSGKSLRDNHLKELTAEVLGLESFDEEVFLKQIDYISVRDVTHLTFHFYDGRTEGREYEFRKEGVKWTDDRRVTQTQAIRESFTPERRQKISKKMKKIRSEKYWNSKRK